LGPPEAGDFGVTGLNLKLTCAAKQMEIGKESK
jgi:hypothetical protein